MRRMKRRPAENTVGCALRYEGYDWWHTDDWSEVAEMRRLAQAEVEVDHPERFA